MPMSEYKFNEDDLLGGFRLIDGETVFQKGPVVKAMEAGAILLIDEIDRGSNKIMCLQGVPRRQARHDQKDRRGGDACKWF